jgi:glycosyltransferase involved in cell wall biosynthesis
MIDVYFGQMVAAKEAMACGCATILNEPTERLLRFHEKEIKAGVMLYGDSEKIVEKLINDKEYYKKISKKSFEFIKENYDTPKILDKIIGVYKEVLK